MDGGLSLDQDFFRVADILSRPQYWGYTDLPKFAPEPADLLEHSDGRRMTVNTYHQNLFVLLAHQFLKSEKGMADKPFETNCTIKVDNSRGREVDLIYATAGPAREVIAIGECKSNQLALDEVKFRGPQQKAMKSDIEKFCLIAEAWQSKRVSNDCFNLKIQDESAKYGLAPDCHYYFFLNNAYSSNGTRQHFDFLSEAYTRFNTKFPGKLSIFLLEDTGTREAPKLAFKPHIPAV